MRKRCLGLGMLVALLTLTLASQELWAAPSSQQIARLRDADAALKNAAIFYKTGKFQESGDRVQEAQAIVYELSQAENAKELERYLESLNMRLKNAHALLELEGIKLPPLGQAPAQPTNGENGAGGVSFTKQIAPILVGKCGNCHIRNARGNFTMATFAELEKGPPEGIVVMPGKGKGSRIVEVIESGDMPRGGTKLTAEELDLLVKWIDEGAKFDGQNKATPLASIVPRVEMPEQPKLGVVAASGKETVSFASDIAPVLAASCTGCHGGQNPRGDLRLQTFASLLRGGDSGNALIPGKPNESLLFKKISGTSAGDRMPLNQPPLSDEVIKKFETWIAEGAKFDGPDPEAEMQTVVAYAFATRASHEDLTARRIEIAKDKWHLTIPEEEAAEVETKNFLVIGNASQEMLQEVGQVAETQAETMAKILRLPTDKPLVKGRVTIYVFRQHFDYAEFGKMVEKRSLPHHWQGHWGYDVIDAYGAIHPPRENEYSLAALVSQQVMGTYVASLSTKVPDWFADGAGRAMAARVAAKDPRVQAWEDRIPAALASISKPDAFMDPKAMSPEDRSILAYSFVKSLMSNQSRFNAVLDHLAKGVPLDQALIQTYGAPPQQLALAWAAKTARKR